MRESIGSKQREQERQGRLCYGRLLPLRASGRSRVLAYRPELAEPCTSDSSSEDNNDEGEGGLGRRSGSQSAVSTSPPADSSGSIRHGRLLPRSLSASWSAFKAAQKATWARAWSASTTGVQLHAITTSPPGLAFTRFHSLLSRRQLTLLTQFCTGACNLGAYKAHFKPKRLMCVCGGEPETREHFLLHCPLYASQCATLLPPTQKHHPRLPSQRPARGEGDSLVPRQVWPF
jgi:hypothetical protein